MRPLRALLMVAALAVPASAAETLTETFTDGSKNWTYVLVPVQGWKLFVHRGLLPKNNSASKAVFNAMVEGLTIQLTAVKALVPAAALPTLQAVSLWASDEPTYPLREGEQGLLTYHSSKEWLRANGLNPYMAGGIHIINPKHAVVTHKILDEQPMVMLHELTHAYHSAALQGAKDAKITAAYDAAMARKLYDSVPERGGGSGRVRAYAASNKTEYLAELTEAYFGTNDYCPMTRSELFLHDQEGLRLVEASWGIS